MRFRDRILRSTEENATAPLSRRAAIRAALAPVAFALLILLTTLVLLRGADAASGALWWFPVMHAHNLAMIVGLLLLLLLIAIAAWTLLRGLPPALYAWFAVPVILEVLVLNLLIEDREVIISQPVDAVLLLLFGLAVVIPVVDALLGGWRSATILSIGLCSAIGLSFGFWVLYQGANAAVALGLLAVSLVMAALVYAAARAGGRVMIPIFLAVALVSMLPSVYVNWFLSRTVVSGRSQLLPVLPLALMPLVLLPTLALIWQGLLKFALARTRARSADP